MHRLKRASGGTLEARFLLIQVQFVIFAAVFIEKQFVCEHGEIS